MPRTSWTRQNILLAFIAGFIAVLVFHQGMLQLLVAIGLTERSVFPGASTAPFQVPAIWSAAFFGGLWGIVLVSVHQYFGKGARYWSLALLFGALGPTLVNWFIVMPLQGAPLGGGWQPAGMLTGLLVNAAWGLGTAIFLGMFHHSGGKLAPSN